MGWGAQQWLRATKEATYGTFDAEADAADVAWFRLPQGNAFTMRAVPQRVVIRSADGGNRRRQQVSARKVVAGALSTLWYPTQSAFLLNAALTLTSNDLASYTLDYFDTQQVHRLLGCKVQSLTLNGDAQGDWIPAQVAWVGQSKGTTTLAQPADAAFPAEVPYEHVESKGGLSIGGVVAKYSSLGIQVENVLAPCWDEDQWITSLYYAGRDVNLTLRQQYLTTAMRAAFEAQSALTVSAYWDRPGGQKTAFTLGTKNYIADLGDDLPIDGAAYQTIGLQAFYEQTAGTDCAFAVTGP